MDKKVANSCYHYCDIFLQMSQLSYLYKSVKKMKRNGY